MPHDLKNRLDFKLPFSSQALSEVDDSMDTMLSNFIYGLCNGDEAICSRLQEILSTALINVNLGKIFYLVGGESGGRVVLLQLLEDAVGHDSCSNLSFSDMAKNFRLPHIIGKHCNISYEEGDQVIGNIDTLKKFAHNAGINTDKKHQDPFDFIGNAKIFCGGRKLPNVAHGKINDIAHELEIVQLAPEYYVDFMKKRRLLRMTHSFILWLVSGALRLAEQEFQFTKAEGCELRDQTTHFEDFLDKRIKASPEGRIHSNEISALYRHDMGIDMDDLLQRDRIGLHGTLQRKFGVEMAKSVRADDGVSSGYKGITLKNDDD